MKSGIREVLQMEIPGKVQGGTAEVLIEISDGKGCKNSAK